jgi:hypothetical protein
MVVELQYDQPFRRLAGPSSDQQVEVRSDLFFEGVRREVLYDRGRDYEVMNPQFEGGLVMICKRYGLHNYRLGQRRRERLIATSNATWPLLNVKVCSVALKLKVHGSAISASCST